MTARFCLGCTGSGGELNAQAHEEEGFVESGATDTAPPQRLVEGVPVRFVVIGGYLGTVSTTSPNRQIDRRVGRSSFEGGQRQAKLSAIESQGGTMLGMLAIAGTGYGLIGLLVIILLIVLIVYFARRA